MLDHILRLELHGANSTTSATAPAGKATCRFTADQVVYARAGDEDAAVPGSGFDASGLASFPFAANVEHLVPCPAGARLTFASASSGVLFVSFE